MTQGRDTTTAITLLDDATRPKAPKIEGITPEQRQWGQRLALFHEFHLEEINRVRRVMEHVAAGEESIASLREAISSLQMTANYRLFGNLCGRECQMLTLHHMIEDEHVFPALGRGSDGLRAVVARLREEHVVIHQLLLALEERAVKAVEDPGAKTFAELKAAFLALERVVRSHFGYEQEELEEALGHFEVPI